MQNQWVKKWQTEKDEDIWGVFEKDFDHFQQFENYNNAFASVLWLAVWSATGRH